MWWICVICEKELSWFKNAWYARECGWLTPENYTICLGSKETPEMGICYKCK